MAGAGYCTVSLISSDTFPADKSSGRRWRIAFNDMAALLARDDGARAEPGFARRAMRAAPFLSNGARARSSHAHAQAREQRVPHFAVTPTPELPP